MKIILASTSKFKAKVLTTAGVQFEQIASTFVEDMTLNVPPEELALTLAMGKAKNVAARYPDSIVIGSDVFVSFEDQVIGQPRDTRDVRARLLAYRGKEVKVVCGLAVLKGDEKFTHVEKARIVFRSDLTEQEIDTYIASGMPLQSSGAFTHEDIGANLIEFFEGDHTSVIGLPLYKTLAFLRKFGVNPLCRP